MANERSDTRPPNASARPISHFMKAPAAAALLCEQHGREKARAMALRKQREARRARSRRQFEFWAEVTSLIDAEGRRPIG